MFYSYAGRILFKGITYLFDLYFFLNNPDNASDWVSCKEPALLVLAECIGGKCPDFSITSVMQTSPFTFLCEAIAFVFLISSCLQLDLLCEDLRYDHEN